MIEVGQFYHNLQAIIEIIDKVNETNFLVSYKWEATFGSFSSDGPFETLHTDIIHMNYGRLSTDEAKKLIIKRTLKDG